MKLDLISTSFSWKGGGTDSGRMEGEDGDDVELSNCHHSSPRSFMKNINGIIQGHGKGGEEMAY